MKKLGLILGLFFAVIAADAQQISKLKIEELKNIYSKGDSIYVVNFWATFCKPCIEEIPFLQEISKKYATSKVRLILVSLDVPALYPARLSTFAKKHKMTASLEWLDETNADKFCPVIDPSWSGAIPATLIYNSKTGYRKFTEEEYTAKSFEEELKKAMN